MRTKRRTAAHTQRCNFACARGANPHLLSQPSPFLRNETIIEFCLNAKPFFTFSSIKVLRIMNPRCIRICTLYKVGAFMLVSVRCLLIRTSKGNSPLLFHAFPFTSFVGKKKKNRTKAVGLRLLFDSSKSHLNAKLAGDPQRRHTTYHQHITYPKIEMPVPMIKR